MYECISHRMADIVGTCIRRAIVLCNSISGVDTAGQASGKQWGILIVCVYATVQSYQERQKLYNNTASGVAMQLLTSDDHKIRTYTVRLQ